ncbi:MAG: hypothetical protein KF683_14475 [Rubrivivax sp.]|nr:hypothetical protein [Rubrivivax sp.]
MTRQARRRWQLAAGEAFPPPLQAWLDAAETLCARWLSRSEAATDAPTDTATDAPPMR